MKHTGCGLAALFAAALLVPLACSSEAPLAPKETQGEPSATAVPTEPPPQAKPPDEPEDAGPSLPDAGNEPVDAGDDCARTAPSRVCGLTPQCGCGANETCDVRDVAGNVACVAFGKGKAGAPCTATPGCAKGLTCVFGTCHAFCDASSDAGGACSGATCVQIETSAAAPIPNLAVCTMPCDLREPNACGGMTPAGTGVCSLDGAGSTDCRAGGNLTEKQQCSASDPCGPGLVCITLTQGNDKREECRRWCHVGTNDCGGAKSCQGFSQKLIVDGIEHGICQ